MNTDTIEVNAGYNSVVEAIKETFHNHYHEFRIDEERASGYYEISHERKDVEIGVYEMGDHVEVELVSVPNQLKKKVRSSLNSVGNSSDSRYKSRRERKEDRKKYEEMMESHSGTGSDERDIGDETIGLVETFDDGSIKFTPPFTKDDANYREHSDDEDGKSCQDCAHYIEGGGCHLVQGGISPDSYCTEFYADVGIFAHAVRGSPLLNLIMWGEAYRDNWGSEDIDDLLDLAESSMNNKL